MGQNPRKRALLMQKSPCATAPALTQGKQARFLTPGRAPAQNGHSLDSDWLVALSVLTGLLCDAKYARPHRHADVRRVLNAAERAATRLTSQRGIAVGLNIRLTQPTKRITTRPSQTDTGDDSGLRKRENSGLSLWPIAYCSLCRRSRAYFRRSQLSARIRCGTRRILEWCAAIT